MARRITVLGWLIALTVVGLTVRYGFVQLREGDTYRMLAENNRLRRDPIRAPRGEIYDAEGRLLAETVPSYSLELYRSRAADVAASIALAARVLDEPRESLAALVSGVRHEATFRPVLLAENLGLEEVARLRALSLEHPEFEVVVQGRRFHRYGPQTAALLGYLGEVNEEELAGGEGRYRAGDLIGRRGVERVFDERLRGRDGERELVVDSHGRPREAFVREPAQAGASLRLTLDLDLQIRAQRALADQAGAIVALDPRDGAIRALASSPGYDSNLFARRLARDDWEKLIGSPLHPLQNRALQVTQSPGSVFKIVMATAGLAEGVVGPGSRVYCAGGAHFYGHLRRCWKAGGHGWVDLRSAILQSCDVYFYHLGEKLGIDRIAAYARRFGFGATTGVDLDGEIAGLVPDSEWSARERGIPWYPGETISVAIGQGPLLTTPLQLAVMTAAVANGGRLVIPHVVVDEASRESRPTGIDPAILARLREALWGVVNDRGTGGNARVPGHDVAGKTGTVQVIRQTARVDNRNLPYEHRDHAWFTSFAPAFDPELVVVVYVEHGGGGSRAAAPLARQVYEAHFGIPSPELG